MQQYSHYIIYILYNSMQQYSHYIIYILYNSMQQYIIHSPSTIMTRFAIAAINSKIKDRISKVMSSRAVVTAHNNVPIKLQLRLKIQRNKN